MYMAKLGMKPSKETVQEWKKCYEILKQDAKIMNSCFKLLVTADSDLTKIDFKQVFSILKCKFSDVGASFQYPDKQFISINPQYKNQYLQMMKDILRCSIIAISLRVKKHMVAENEQLMQDDLLLLQQAFMLDPADLHWEVLRETYR